MNIIGKILLSIFFIILGIFGGGLIMMSSYFPGRILFSVAVSIAGFIAARAVWTKRRKENEGDVFKNDDSNTLDKS